METKRVMIEDRSHTKDGEPGEAASILRPGGLVVFPTGTVYGLGGNAPDEDAARKIYAAEERPSDNPLTAHISCMEEVVPLVKKTPEVGRKLMETFWPGPLTMIFPKSDKVPYGTTGGLDTAAIHMPNDLVTNRFIALVGVPAAVPSANTSGRPSPITVDHVWQDVNGRTEMIIDGGPVEIGVESIIVDVSSAVPTVLRPGAITMEIFEAVLGDVSMDSVILDPLSADVRLRAPGMKHKRYAPKAGLILMEPEDVDREDGLDGEQPQATTGKAREFSRGKIGIGCKVGVICTDESRRCYTDGAIRSIGERKSRASVAHSLYTLPREFDDLGVDHIFSESSPKDHLGQAIMNRLSEVAGYETVKA